GGIEMFGLDRTATIGDVTYSGVGYAVDKYNVDLVSAEMITKVEEAKENIVKGRISIPTE
ncbi:unnamed protein product, partial [marine sediment metagenome]